eukprot:755442-Hanusia_phi.AAC.2
MDSDETASQGMANDRGSDEEGAGEQNAEQPNLFPGARAQVHDDFERERGDQEGHGQHRTLVLALKLMFVVVVLGQDASRERMHLESLWLASPGWIASSFLRCPSARFLVDSGCVQERGERLQYDDGEIDHEDNEEQAVNQEGRVAEGGGGEGITGLLVDITALLVSLSSVSCTCLTPTSGRLLHLARSSNPCPCSSCLLIQPRMSERRGR